MLTILSWGAVAGVVHFALLGLLYGNPFVDRIYRAAEDAPSVRKWPSKLKYRGTQFLGTQVEVFILTLAFLWLRPLIGTPGLAGALLLGGMLAAVRVYPRFWNMWIQSTYPKRLLAIELINGSVGTLVIAVFLQAAAVR